MSATLKDIASHTQLSIRSVSRILNLNEGELFRSETRQKVIEAARELGYRPNSSARAMRSGRRSAIGLLLSTDPQRSVVPFGTLVGLQRTLSQESLQLVVGEIRDQKLTDQNYIPRLLREWSTDGMLIAHNQRIPARMTELLDQFRVPSVWMNAKLPHDCVYPDDEGAGRLLTQKLIEMGHRRIEYLAYTPNAHHSRQDRINGYKATMREAGLPSRIWEAADGSTSTVVPDLRNQLSQADRPTAYIAADAADARAMFVAALRLGIEVPAQLSIAGIVDDGRDFDLGTMRLTGVELPREQLGIEAARLIVRKVASPNDTLNPLAIPFDFRSNDSAVACP